MTMGWHTVMEFSPSLVGCVIASSNFSFEIIRKSRECVINVPSVELLNEVVGIGNCSGDKVDKFDRFHLTAVPGAEVAAPLIRECFVNLECRIADGRLNQRLQLLYSRSVKGPCGHRVKQDPNPSLSGQRYFYYQRRIGEQTTKIHQMARLP
jgi:flavin reductase (DIM6/NTAB) family NADH-FMN oxidoreductase RutF